MPVMHPTVITLSDVVAPYIKGYRRNTWSHGQKCTGPHRAAPYTLINQKCNVRPACLLYGAATSDSLVINAHAKLLTSKLQYYIPVCCLLLYLDCAHKGVLQHGRIQQERKRTTETAPSENITRTISL